jgi:hypothetical protein
VLRDRAATSSWRAVPRSSVAAVRRSRCAVAPERVPAGSVLHAVTDEGDPMRDLAQPPATASIRPRMRPASTRSPESAA